MTTSRHFLSRKVTERSYLSSNKPQTRLHSKTSDILLRIASKRSYLTSNNPQTEIPKDRFHSRDNVPEDYILIHTNFYEKNFKYLVGVVPLVLGIYLGLFKLYLNNLSVEKDDNKENWDTETPAFPNTRFDEYLFSIFGNFDKREHRVTREQLEEENDNTFTVLAFFVHSFTVFIFFRLYRQCILRVYKHIDYPKYIAILPRMFVSRNKWMFSLKDVKPKKLKYEGFAWCLGNVKIQNRTFLLPAYDFKLPIYYNELFGF